MLHDAVNPQGSLSITVYGADGEVKDRLSYDNLIVDTGLAFLAQRLIGSAPALTHMGAGTSTVEAADAQTGLISELARVTIDSTTNTTTTVANDSASFTATFAAGVATGALTELGLFTAATGGTMMSRVVFPVYNKQALDSMAVTWTIKFQRPPAV